MPPPILPIANPSNSCTTCTYYDKHHGDDCGLCRRYPPITSVPNGNSTWFMCKDTDWCGEWKKK